MRNTKPKQKTGVEQETTRVEAESPMASQSGQTLETKESSTTPAEEVQIVHCEKRPQVLGAFASFISNPGNSLASRYTTSTIAALEPKDVLQSIVAAQLSAANTLALEQAAAVNRTNILEAEEFHERAFTELSRLTLELTNAYITIQNNTQTNQINIEKVSVEKGAQAIVGCVTNAPAEQKQLRSADNENQEMSRPRHRAKRKPSAS